MNILKDYFLLFEKDSWKKNTSRTEVVVIDYDEQERKYNKIEMPKIGFAKFRIPFFLGDEAFYNMMPSDAKPSGEWHVDSVEKYEGFGKIKLEGESNRKLYPVFQITLGKARLASVYNIHAQRSASLIVMAATMSSLDDIISSFNSFIEKTGLESKPFSEEEQSKFHEEYEKIISLIYENGQLEKGLINSWPIKKGLDYSIYNPPSKHLRSENL